MTHFLLRTLVIGTIALANLVSTASAAETAFQNVCEKTYRNLPKEYQPQYEPANKNSPQLCQIYSAGFAANPVNFGVVKAFNEACISDGSSRGVQLAPSQCIDELKTCVLNVRCAPND